jgi:hypothetical protein
LIILGQVISLNINAQYGENAVTNPENEQIPESILFKSSLSDEYEVLSKSNIHDIFLQNEFRKQLIELKSAILRIHHKLTNGLKKDENVEFGVDVEFKLMAENDKYRLYIKQARLLRFILPD